MDTWGIYKHNNGIVYSSISLAGRESITLKHHEWPIQPDYIITDVKRETSPNSLVKNGTHRELGGGGGGGG